MSRPIIKENLKTLDALRGLAAIYVVIHHCRWLLWEGYEKGYSLHPSEYSFFSKVFMYFFSAFKFGNQAVLFFFVLSGFVIHYSVSKRVDREGKFDAGDYLYRRIKRIYPPLLIAIALTFVLDMTGMKLNLPIYFSHTPYPSINTNVHSDLSGTTLLGNLLFVQKIYTPAWGTDGALWSLMYEWWFYILYMPLLLLFRKNKYLTIGIVLVVWYLNVLYGAGLPVLLNKVLNMFLIWFAGMLLADMLLYKSINPIAGLAALLLMMTGSFADIFGRIGYEIILTVFITIFLYLVLTTNWFNILRKCEKLGPFSYTMYAVHMPIVCFLSGFLMKANQGYLPSHFLYVFAGIIISVTVSWLLHFVGEKPFTKK
ncbi:MAG TPA: acyltransferase [Chitinophagaceae bacterium]|nr:acyltransferase [Chitinophagaceae bacterium]